MDNPKPLENRIALVTGASRGIGAAAALAFAKAGAHVVATARTVGGLEELDDAIRTAGGTATLVPLDMKDFEGVVRLGDALNERFHKLDILVANAGVLGVGAPLGHVEPKVWDNLLTVNLTANWHLIRVMDPLLKKSDAGRALFVTSAIAWLGRAYLGPYAATKAALNAMAQAYATESAATALRVNLFSPGPTRTRMYATAFPGVDPATLTAPEDVAEKIVAACLPSVSENGKLYDFPSKRWLSLMPPA
jgi:NAD(P)-dependent dehydrogenase (short-subunit alcohol dehydrogenase family)